MNNNEESEETPKQQILDAFFFDKNEKTDEVINGMIVDIRYKIFTINSVLLTIEVSISPEDA